MSETRPQEELYGVRLLALALALLLWLAVMVERPLQLTIPVPVTLEHLPAGLQLASAPPGPLQITISGPAILLVRPFLLGTRCTVDLSEVQPGSVSFGALDSRFALDGELKVVRATPSLLHLNFTPLVPR